MMSRGLERWMALLTLCVMALTVVALGASAESHTWDDEVAFDGGDHDATVWDADAGGITMTGEDIFWKYRGDALVQKGSSGAWDDASVSDPTVVFAAGQFYMYYTGNDGSDDAIGLARSSDGKAFTKYGSSALISKGSSGSYDGDGCREPSVIYEDGVFKMWYTGINGGAESIALATSKDGLTWSKYGSNPVLSQPGSGWGSNEFGDPCVILIDGRYVMYLSGSSVLNSKLVGIATSTDGTSWTYHASNPVVSKATSPAFGQQEICDVAVVRDGPVFRMYFSGRNNAGDKFRLGYGESFDGFDWRLSKTKYIDVGASGAFDDDQLMAPGTIMDGEGTIHMYYAGNDGTDWAIGLTSYRQWPARPNTPNDKILGVGSTYDSTHLLDPSVVKNSSGVYTMFYGCYGGGSYPYAVAKATSSSPASSWSKYASNPVLSKGTSGDWDDERVGYPCVVFEYGVYRMWYAGYDGSEWAIGYATSTDGNSWTKYGSNPILSLSTGKWDSVGVRDPWVLRVGNTYHMWYVGWSSASGYMVGHATSSDGTSWTKDSANPVLEPEPLNDWEAYYIENPCVVRDNGHFIMYYSGGYTSNKQRIGLAYSDDGANWSRDPLNPYMDWGNDTLFSDDGVAMGSVLIEGGMHRMYYAGYDGSSWTIGYASLSSTRATYTTPALDASSAWPVAWGSLTWDAEVPLGATLRFQVATNQGGTVWRFVGPDGTADSYFVDPGEGIFWFQSGKRIRVRAYMTTDDMTKWTPVLRSVTVTYSSRPAAFPPSVHVTSPNGGEDWMKTKAYPITWEASGNLNDTSVSLAYSTDNGTSWTNIATRQPNTGHYKWTVPSTETSGGLVRVTVIDIDGGMAEDTSDATFAIDPPAPKAGRFLSPAGGTVLVPGPTSLAWTVEDPWGLAESPLSLDLSTDGGSTWTQVASRLPFTDGIQWEVPELETSSDRCMLRLSVLTWLGDVSVIGSDAFSIDVVPPDVTLAELPRHLVTGREVVVSALAEDDLQLVGVVLHVSGAESVRAYEMAEGDAGVWTLVYVPLEGDAEAWITATDGAHEASSTVHVLSLKGEAAPSSSGTASLAMELVLASALAALVTVVIAVALVRRRRGRA